MASIVENQRRAYLAKCEDAASVFAGALLCVSPAQRAALLASVAHHSQTPVDITLTTGEREDPREAAQILDGDLNPAEDGSWSWHVGSGCSFVIDLTRKDTP